MATTKKKVTALQYQEALNGYISNNTRYETQAAKYIAELEKLEKKYKPGLDEITAEQEKQETTVQQYCEENRATLFGEAQTIEVNGAKLAFKAGTAKVALTVETEGMDKEALKLAWERALQAVKKKLPEYVRTEEELAKNLLLEHKDIKGLGKKLEACGLKISAEETFSIKIPKPKKK